MSRISIATACRIISTIPTSMITLIGPPPNIVIAEYRGTVLGEPYRMFDFTPVGAVVAVVFPQLREIGRSRPYTERVVTHLRGLGVDVIDLTEHLDGRPPDELIVGPLDNHPGPALHAEVAGLIDARIPR